LSEGEQKVIDEVAGAGQYKIDMKTADTLRLFSEKGALSRENVEKILSGVNKSQIAKPEGFRLKSKIISKYFTPEQSPKEIEETIIKALESYFSRPQ